MNAKLFAVLAVVIVGMAGIVGAAGAADADDPAPVTYDLTVVYDGYISDADALAAIGAIGATVSFKAQFVDNLEEVITILNLAYYEALEDAGLIDGDSVVFSTADLANNQIKKGIQTFTVAEFTSTGKLAGGVDTILTFADVLPGAEFDEALTYEIIDSETAAIDTAIAVAIAVAEATEGMVTQEELAAAIAKVKEEYPYTQADLDKAVADAKAAAGNSDKVTLWMAIAIIMAVGLVAMGAYTAFGILKANKAKKAAKQENA